MKTLKFRLNLAHHYSGISRRVAALKAATFLLCLFHLLNPGEVTDGVVTVFVKIIAGGILCKNAANLCWSEARNQAINESALVWKPHKNVRWLFSIWCSNIGFERCHFSTTHGVKYIGMCSTWTRQMNTFIRDLNEIHLVILSHNVTRENGFIVQLKDFTIGLWKNT